MTEIPRGELFGGLRHTFKRNLLKMREAFEVTKALVDLFMSQALNPLGAELLNVERRHD